MQTQQFQATIAGKTLTIEVGKLAQQANGSCVVRYGDTVVLATVVMGGIREGVDYFPLSVEYEERLYAAGIIKGSRWIKREGRPSDESVLTARMVDRCIRPLFDKSIKNEVQVVLTVLSYDKENDSDIVALVAASTALSISDIPWNGPVAGMRIGRVDGKLIVNPTMSERENSDMDVVAVGKDGKLIMTEVEGKEVTEDIVYEAFEHGLAESKQVTDLINQVVVAAGKPKAKLGATVVEEEAETPEAHKELLEKAQTWINEHVAHILFDQTLQTKKERKGALAQAKVELDAYLEANQIGKDRRKKAMPLLDAFVETEVTRAILAEDRRVDGRKLTEIRPLSVEVGVLPRTHGSALFNRGETQVLSIVTLGAPGDEQSLEGIEGSGKKHYMHHYNFPPFSVGEAGRVGAPSRRDIGHGALAEKALVPVLPTKEEFPYTIRVVSEVLGSNGSSSMASVCGSSLSLMDAGVPIKKPVAGIAMGLASDGQGSYKVLTDLQDMEDGMGGMDFKIAGTEEGITAIQLDTKTDGLPAEVVKQTLMQGKVARLEVLKVMTNVLATPRTELSKHAPRIISFRINPDKIREVIGPGGKVINEIIAATQVQIDIEDDGLVMVTAVEEAGGQKAVDWIKQIVHEVTPGEVYDGTVARIMDFGAIVDILPGQDGMVHISEIDYKRVDKVSDYLKLGDKVKVKVLAVEGDRISLSIKALKERPEGYDESANRSNDGGRFSRGNDRGHRPNHHR